MFLDMASAALALVLLLVTWFVPLALFLSSTRMRGAEKYNWALLVTVLTWPGYALYLFINSGQGRHS